MKYIVSDGYLKYHNKETGYLRNMSNDIYCAALGQIYKLEQDSDILCVGYKDGEFVTEHKNFKSGTIILITHNDDVIDITDGSQMTEHITNTVEERIQMYKKSEQSEIGCNDSCAG